MAKSADAFRTISEVADWLETPAHVLRFWESKFSQVKPVKRAGGRRYYRPADMKLLGGIKKLLHDDGMTIKGVQKMLREQGVAHVSEYSQPLGDAADDVVIERAEEASSSGIAGTKARRPDPKQSKPETDEKPLTFSRRSEEKPKEPAPPPPEELEAPTLPSFLQRRETTTPSTHKTATDGADAQDKASEVEKQASAPVRPQPARVDVPADPSDDLTADPGVLSLLSRLPRPLSRETAERLETLVSKLRATTASATKD